MRISLCEYNWIAAQMLMRGLTELLNDVSCLERNWFWEGHIACVWQRGNGTAV